MRYGSILAGIFLGIVLLYSPTPALVAEAPTPLIAYEVKLKNRDALAQLRREKLILSQLKPTRDGWTASVYTTSRLAARLRAQGYHLKTVHPPTPGPRLSNNVMGQYHDYAGVTQLMQTFANQFPKITRLVTLGKSIEGRELWALKLTDNPDIEEDEPEFKYVSTMHGDEPVGTELLLYLLDDILNQYGSNPRITRLIDETESWFVPLMNPDGLEARQRFNAQLVDLNRDFPDFPDDLSAGTIFDGAPLNATGRAPETQHVMLWSAQHSFVLSANLHTGALVVNYPYDDDDLGSVFSPSPDELLFQDISTRYAQHNPPMFDNNIAPFTNGIVNGAHWFSIDGGMQDWNYRYLGCHEVTLELSDPKTPLPARLPQLWADNRESLLAYMEAVHIGVRGMVTDATTGEPIYAKVDVFDVEHFTLNTQPVFTDPDVGDYHRLLLPGSYVLRISAPGYHPTTLSSVDVVEGTTTRIDVQLQPRVKHEVSVNQVNAIR